MHIWQLLQNNCWMIFAKFLQQKVPLDIKDSSMCYDNDCNNLSRNNDCFTFVLKHSSHIWIIFKNGENPEHTREWIVL